MNGADYVATVRLTTKKGDVLAEVGDRCDRVPAESLSWLIEQNLIALPGAEVPVTYHVSDVGSLVEGEE